MFYEAFARRVQDLYKGRVHVIVSSLANHTQVPCTSPTSPPSGTPEHPPPHTHA
jgi:hypothetical protein